MSRPEVIRRVLLVGDPRSGKATLLGRLLLESGEYPVESLQSLREAAVTEGVLFEESFLVRHLPTDQPIRISDVEFALCDAAERAFWIRSIVGGTWKPEAAIVVVPAGQIDEESTRAHFRLLELLGISHVAVAVSYADALTGEAWKTFHSGCEEQLRSWDLHPQAILPTRGDDEDGRSSHAGLWNFLRAAPLSLPASKKPLRVLVDDVYRFEERRIVSGRVDSGRLAAGDELVFWPDRRRARVKAMEAPASAGEAVTFELEEEIFIEPGQIASRPGEGPAEGREIHASVFWLASEPLHKDQVFHLRLGGQSAEGRLVEIIQGTEELKSDQIAEVKIRLKRPVAFDRHDLFETTGRFVLVRGGVISGGGLILEAVRDKELPPVASGNITWTLSPVSRETRAERLGHREAVIWLTGLSGSGKSTLATGLEYELHRRGMNAFILDGDNLRHGLCANLKFSPEDRSENIRRAGETARLMADAGLIVICSLISPYRADRDRVREICQRDGISFAEIFIDASLEVCEARDPRGLYRRARKGEIADFTGVTSPYEKPLHPELAIPTGGQTSEASVDRLLEYVLQLVRLS